MLRFINKNFFRIESTDGELTLIKTAAFLAGKDGKPSVFAKAFSKNSDHDFKRFNDNPISTYLTKVEGNVNLLSITSDAKKDPEKYASKDVVLIALPFDGLVVGPQEFDGYQILKAACIKDRTGHNVKFNNRKFGNIMYLAVEISKDLTAAGTYKVTIPFDFYTSHREEGKSVENKWHKLNVQIEIANDAMHVIYGKSEFLEDFDIKTVKQNGIKVVSPNPRKQLNYK